MSDGDEKLAEVVLAVERLESALLGDEILGHKGLVATILEAHQCGLQTAQTLVSVVQRLEQVEQRQSQSLPCSAHSLALNKIIQRLEDGEKRMGEIEARAKEVRADTDLNTKAIFKIHVIYSTVIGLLSTAGIVTLLFSRIASFFQ